jgi:hypothetical protein
MSLQDNLVKGARVYRFGDHVAMSWIGAVMGNGSHYITPEVAEALGTHIVGADGTVRKEGS